jgi:uncharacterized protein (DUF2141 family)
VSTKKTICGVLSLTLVLLLSGLTGCSLGGGGKDPSPNSPTTGSAAITVNDGTVPIEGASVTLAGTTQKTNAAGQAAFSDVPGGSYTVTVTKSGCARCSADLRIVAGETASITISLAAGGNATITVDDSSNPIAGASVTLDGQTIVTDAGGAASFTDLAAGDYTASAVKNGYTSGHVPVTVAAGSMAHATISLSHETGSVTITINDGSSPMAGASVTLDGRTLTTDTNGLAAFSEVPTGPYTVSASAPAYRVNTAAINVAKDATTNATISLTRQRGDVVVRVAQNPSNQPICSATVTLEGRTAVTDPNGYAEFRDVPVGSYTVRASSPVYQEKTAGVTVADYGSTQCELLLDRWVGRVALLALKANGSPLAGAKVDMYYPAVDRMPTSPTKEAHGLTDVTGHFVIDGVVNGVWWTVVAPQLDPWGPPMGTVVTVNESTVTVTVQSSWWN